MRNIILTIICVSLLSVAVMSKAPKDFPQDQFNFHIEKGDSISKIADSLFAKKMIRSELFFKVAAITISINNGVLAGDYKFTEKENVISIAYRLVTGDQRQKKIRITIPEGTNVADMAFIFLKKLPDFNAPRFVSLAKQYEGYLYPDTYDFLASTNSEEILRVMRKTFNEKIATIDSDLKKFNKPLKDVVIMASIIEKEANNDVDRRIISGILWKRIQIGMPLQVDPVFYYITGKTTGVTYEDLKVDSPYNTYKYKGLPKGPITSASIETIKDTINPTPTKYLFYLTGNDGKMRYAQTYDQHLVNKEMYLKK